jgi:LmbE family N-acetylglucosaminyl deacetylase
MAFPNLARAGFAPHRVRRLYLFWPGTPTAWVDVGAAIERKIEALRCHESQLTVDAAFEQRMRDWAAEDGRAIGVAAAEAFRAIVIDDDEDSPAPADEDTPAPTE